MAQTIDYADGLNSEEAYLVIFNRNPEIPWEEKIWQKQQSHNGREINIWGM